MSALYGDNKIIDHDIYSKYIEEKYRKQIRENLINKGFLSNIDLDIIFKLHKEKRKTLINSWRNNTETKEIVRDK